MQQQIVINTQHGGFGLSKQAQDLLATKKNQNPGTWHESSEYYEDFDTYDLARDDRDLVAVVLELGDKSWGQYAELKVVTIPADVEWSIHEYDGMEWVAENHRTWS